MLHFYFGCFVVSIQFIGNNILWFEIFILQKSEQAVGKIKLLYQLLFVQNDNIQENTFSINKLKLSSTKLC
jgi:hypothetical protein